MAPRRLGTQPHGRAPALRLHRAGLARPFYRCDPPSVCRWDEMFQDGVNGSRTRSTSLTGRRANRHTLTPWLRRLDSNQHDPVNNRTGYRYLTPECELREYGVAVPAQVIRATASVARRADDLATDVAIHYSLRSTPPMSGKVDLLGGRARGRRKLASPRPRGLSPLRAFAHDYAAGRYFGLIPAHPVPS